jgi:hypothetical protein
LVPCPARAPTRRSRPNHLDASEKYLLDPRNADGPGEPARGERTAERGADPVTRISEHAPEADAGGNDPVEFGDGDFGLGSGSPECLGHAGAVEALKVARPRLRQEQAQSHGHGDLTTR